MKLSTTQTTALTNKVRTILLERNKKAVSADTLKYIKNHFIRQEAIRKEQIVLSEKSAKNRLNLKKVLGLPYLTYSVEDTIRVYEYSRVPDLSAIHNEIILATIPSDNNDLNKIIAGIVDKFLYKK